MAENGKDNGDRVIRLLLSEGASVELGFREDGTLAFVESFKGDVVVDTYYFDENSNLVE